MTDPTMKGPEHPWPERNAKLFWSNVRKSDGCWEWTGPKLRSGYGSAYMHTPKRLMRAHRVSWEMRYGPIPEGMHICHKCDNPSCVNPEHLFVGDDTANMRDMAAKGRTAIKYGTKNGNSKLTEKDVLFIRNSNKRVKELCKMFGVSDVHIYDIRRKKFWKNLKEAV